MRVGREWAWLQSSMRGVWSCSTREERNGGRPWKAGEATTNEAQSVVICPSPQHPFLGKLVVAYTHPPLHPLTSLHTAYPAAHNPYLLMAPVAASHAADKASHAANAASSQAHTAASRLSRWVEDNKNLAVALGIGTVVAAGGGAYYYFGAQSSKSSRRPKSPPSPRVGDDAEKKSAGEDTKEAESGTSAAAASAAKSKKKKKGKKTTSGGPSIDEGFKSRDGPLLEEASDESLFALSPEEIAKLPQEVSRADNYLRSVKWSSC